MISEQLVIFCRRALLPYTVFSRERASVCRGDEGIKMPANRFSTIPLIILALVLSTFGIMLARSAFDTAAVDHASRPRDGFQGKSNRQAVRIPTFAGTFH